MPTTQLTPVTSLDILHAQRSGEDSTLSFIDKSSKPWERHPVVVYLASLSEGSRRSMLSSLEIIAKLLTGGHAGAFVIDWGQIRFQHSSALRSVLSERYAHTTANRILAALRGVLKAAWRLELIADSDYWRAVDIPAVKGDSLPRGRALNAGEIRALFETCSNHSNADVRDAAILSILYGTGLRRFEMVSLDTADYVVDEGCVQVRSGKGKKARRCFLARGGRLAVEAWITRRGIDGKPLFLPINKGDNIQARRLADQSILTILAKRADMAGIAHVSPHDLRRTMISDLLDAGVDISTVQRIAGHVSVSTTASYDRRHDIVKAKAAEMLHIPYAA